MPDLTITEPSATEIRRLVGVIADGGPDSGGAWDSLRPLGERVVPYLADAYPTARRWQGRVSLVFHAIRHARTSEAAFQLGLRALGDRSSMVRYRACMLLAYSLRSEALPALATAANHADVRTREDAGAAIDAIEHQNHHWFVDRDHSGQRTWEVNAGDSSDDAPRRLVERVRDVLARLLTGAG